MNRNVKFFLYLCAIILIGSAFGVAKVDAVKIEASKCSKISFKSEYKKYGIPNYVKNANNYNFFPSISYFNSKGTNGRISYCIEKGIPPVNSSSGNNPDFKITTHNSDNSMLARVLAYGYYGKASSSCANKRLATQVLVGMATKEMYDGTQNWRKFSENDIKNLLGGDKKSDVAKEAYKIKTSVLQHNILPSFTFTTSEEASSNPNRLMLNYSETNRNFSNSETDSNGVLSTFTLNPAPAGITPSISGNKLTITSKNDSVTTPISMKKTFKDATLYRRSSNTLQDIVNIPEPKNDVVTVYAGYRYQPIGKGKIEIHKVDKYSNKSMKDINFGLYSDDVCTTKAVDYLGTVIAPKKTDENGIVSWDNLYYPLEIDKSRIYYVKEIESPKGYTIDPSLLTKTNAKDGCIPIIIKASYKKDANNVNTTQIDDKIVVKQDIYNIPYGNITILKQNDRNGAVIEGVVFKLLKNDSKKSLVVDINGIPVADVITDKRGIAEFENIPYGDYILKEVKTGNDYKVLKYPLEFTLSKENDALRYGSDGSLDKPQSKDAIIPLLKYKVGDPSDDGVINKDDLDIIDDFIKKQAENTTIDKTTISFFAADVNNDSNVNDTDKGIITKYINGDKTVLPEALKEKVLPGQIEKRITISITNVPIDMKVSKLDIANSKEVPGATIVIKDSKGKIFKKYKSTRKPKQFFIPVGDYTLTETVAPKGFQQLKTSIKFRVQPDGNIKLLSAKSNMYKIDRSTTDNDTDFDHLKIYNNLTVIPAPNTGSVIKISSIILGVSLILGGSYMVYRKYRVQQ